jgi:UDP-N-acetylglucosamine 2-epimerase (non-hydrolysing)
VVREVVHDVLDGVDRVDLLEPVDYLPFIKLMDSSTLILSDSGGMQEEAPSLGKPVLVLRDTTERPEAVEAGTALLVGTNGERVFGEAARLLSDEPAYQAMARMANPFGDGRAAVRIADVLSESL